MNELINLGISAKSNRVLVSSRILAENFNKEHKNVLSKIETISKSWENDNQLKIKLVELSYLPQQKLIA